MHEIITIETLSLGDRSYLAHDGETAAVVDPQRDIDRVEEVAARLGVKIALVVETHIHNDYVTGGLALARKTGSRYVVAAGDKVDFDRAAADDGDRFDFGGLSLSAVHTPGHTANHLSYVLREGDGDPLAVFTGGSMLFGSVGRTDLVGDAMTDELTRAQYHSVRRLASELPDAVQVHPTHGFGSFCSASQTAGNDSTIGQERKQNVALVTDNEDLFVKELTEGLGAYPRYYSHMGTANAGGPSEPDLSPPELVDAAELHRRIDAKEWVVDLRTRTAFAARHIKGTISVELSNSFATFLGWTIPWGTSLTLVGDSAEQVADAQRELVRIGIDRLQGRAVGDLDGLAMGRTGSYRMADFATLAKEVEAGDVVVLDVRRPDEWAGGHVRGASHIPLWELEQRIDEIPPGAVWVHCAGGFRAAIGASLLDRAGRSVVLVDDDWGRASQVGLPIES